MKSTEDKKKLSLIATAASAFLCGCPSLCLMAFGLLFVFGDENSVPDGMPGGLEVGLGFLCIGFIIVLIPLIAAGFTISIWKKAKKSDEYATRGETSDSEVIVEVEVKATPVEDSQEVEEDELQEESTDEDEIPPAI